MSRKYRSCSPIFLMSVYSVSTLAVTANWLKWWAISPELDRSTFMLVGFELYNRPRVNMIMTRSGQQARQFFHPIYVKRFPTNFSDHHKFHTLSTSRVLNISVFHNCGLGLVDLVTSQWHKKPRIKSLSRTWLTPLLLHNEQSLKNWICVRFHFLRQPLKPFLPSFWLTSSIFRTYHLRIVHTDFHRHRLQTCFAWESKLSVEEP